MSASPPQPQPAGECPRCGCARAALDWRDGLVCVSCNTPWPFEGGR